MDAGYPKLPSRPTLPVLRQAVQRCRACDLWANATQAVFGEGKRSATVVFVGEQPGDQEDRLGHPLVASPAPGGPGPAIPASAPRAGSSMTRSPMLASIARAST